MFHPRWCAALAALLIVAAAWRIEDAATMSGAVNGSGFTNMALTLRRS